MHPEACQAEKLKSEQQQLVDAIEVSQLYVTLWGNGEIILYFGHCTSIDNDSIVNFFLDHIIMAIQKGSHNYQ